MLRALPFRAVGGGAAHDRIPHADPRSVRCCS